MHGICSRQLDSIPVCPASQYYVIGTPTFKKITIGEFNKRENVSDKNFYIQSATYNGKPYTHNYITHEMVKGNGVLKFVMGPNLIRIGVVQAAIVHLT